MLTREEILKGKAYGFYVVEDEPIIGYKKICCRVTDSPIMPNELIKCKEEHYIAKVEIPVGATIIRGTYPGYLLFYASDKLRTNTYKILEITPGVDAKQRYKSGNEMIKDAYSMYNPSFKYKVGETYKVTLDKRYDKVCTRGLHFFLDRVSAEIFVY